MTNDQIDSEVKILTEKLQQIQKDIEHIQSRQNKFVIECTRRKDILHTKFMKIADNIQSYQELKKLNPK